MLPKPAGGTAPTWAQVNELRDQLFASPPLDSLATAVQATPEETVTALPADEHGVLTHFIDTAKASDDRAMVERIIGARLAMSAPLPLHLLLPLVL